MTVFISKTLASDVVVDQGQQVFDKLLISQYAGSTNLKGYSSAFIAELDDLFAEMQRVYLGRFMEYATGDQLDVLGYIVGIPREIGIPKVLFGFLQEAGADTFGTSGDITEGGLFRTISPQLSVVELTNDAFRRVIRAKAMCNGAEFQDVNFMYKVLTIILNKVHTVFKLEESGVREITLTLEDVKTDPQSLALVDAMAKFFIPAGYTFTTVLI